MSQTTTAAVKSITPCLVFKERAAEAIEFYVSLFPNSSVQSMARMSAGGPVPEGTLMSGSFELDGKPYVALDGGPDFAFSDGVSLMIQCNGQAEIDRLWDRLTDGGQPGRCGWLKDRFGLSWQVIPADLGEMLGNSAGGNTQKAMEAMLSMNKLDVAALRAAYEGDA
ncbi:MAG: VOC family protein [Candidatus Dormibacteria bacterium]